MHVRTEHLRLFSALFATAFLKRADKKIRVESSLLPDDAAGLHHEIRKEIDNMPPRFVDYAATRDDTQSGSKSLL